MSASSSRVLSSSNESSTLFVPQLHLLRSPAFLTGSPCFPLFREDACTCLVSWESWYLSRRVYKHLPVSSACVVSARLVCLLMVVTRGGCMDLLAVPPSGPTLFSTPLHLGTLLSSRYTPAPRRSSAHRAPPQPTPRSFHVYVLLSTFTYRYIDSRIRVCTCICTGVYVSQCAGVSAIQKGGRTAEPFLCLWWGRSFSLVFCFTASWPFVLARLPLCSIISLRAALIRKLASFLHV